MSFRRPPKDLLGARRKRAVAPPAAPAGSPSAGTKDLPPDLLALIEASAREIAGRVERERSTAQELWAELMNTPIDAWPALAASGRFAVPAFLETLCEESWSLPADRSEALAKFGHQAARRLKASDVGIATVGGLRALTRASLGDAWRRQGRLDEADLAFLGAFCELADSEDEIDLGLAEVLFSRTLRDRGELSDAYFEALLATQSFRREGIAALTAGAWGEVAALAAEIGAWGRVDSALSSARRETGDAAQAAAARAVCRGVLRLRLLGKDSAAAALAVASQRRLAPDAATRADFAAATDFFHPWRFGTREWPSSLNPIQEAIPMSDAKFVVPLSDAEDSENYVVPMLRHPSEWEGVEGFRHTFLIHFTPQGLAASLRQAGLSLYDGALESAGGWPRSRMLPVLEQAMAGAADCRFLEGFFGMVGREAQETSLAQPEIQISVFAVEYAAAARELAARIERDLASVGVKWQPVVVK